MLTLEKFAFLEIKASIFLASIMGLVFIFSAGMSLLREYRFSSQIFFRKM